MGYPWLLYSSTICRSIAFVASNDAVRIKAGESFVLICKIFAGDSLDSFLESVTLNLWGI